MTEQPYGSVIAGKDLDRYFYLHRVGWEFHEVFNVQTPVNDRAIAIIGATFLDTQLEHMLINFLLDDEVEANKLLQPDRPLGTFSSRTTMAYCLGLIGRVIRDDLRLVGKIRNRFAHRLDADFESEPIRSWCWSLRFHEIGMMMKPPEGATTRDVFRVGVNQVIAHLSGLVGLARFDRRNAPRSF
jgi:hypothetical protein